MKNFRFVCLIMILTVLALAAGEVSAKPYVMVSGRWDNTYILIDLEKALDPANDCTDKAVVNRIRYTPDHKDGGVLGGQGINVVIPPGSRYAYVGDHGRMTPDQTLLFQEGKRIQHGFPGVIVVMEIKKALDSANNGTLNAVDEFIHTGYYGATGLAVTPDGKHMFIAHAEQKDSEDGGNLIAIMDMKTRKVVGKVDMKYGNPGFSCPPARMPVGAPDPNFGCFPCTNGIVISPMGGGYLFTANGGTDDVSVIDVQRALAGDPEAEFLRIPVQTGPFGIGVSPDGKYVVSANRESQRTGKEGNTISIIDVKKAIAKDKNAEVARVLVGSNNPDAATRPFMPAFIHDGKHILVTNFKGNNVSVVDLEKAIKGEPAEIQRIPLVTPRKTDPSRPRGIALTPDGRYAAITGDGTPTGKPKRGPGSSMVFILDLKSMEVVGRVTGVGNEAYFLAFVPDDSVI